MAEEKKTLTYVNLTIDDIIDWCKANNQVEWLKAKAAETKVHKKYPKHKIQKEYTDKEGNTVKKWVSVMDKTQPFVEEVVPIPFTSIKKDFCDKFMPELVKSKAEKDKPSFYDRIANL